VVLRVRVTPRARGNALTVDATGVVRARLTAPPVEGAANRALVSLLAGALGLKRAAFEVVHGERGRDKLVAVHGCSEADLAARVARLDIDKTEPRG
jgi:uncharacterized protein YggU (UPF0235/DUF167 family)